MRQGYAVAVVGATGAVGGEVLSLLGERGFPLSRLTCFASDEALGTTVTCAGEDYDCEVLQPDAIKAYDLAFFCAPASVAKTYVPQFVAQKTVVIDASSCYRLCPEVPLIEAEFNREALLWHRGIIASPAAQTLHVLKILEALDEMSRVQRAHITALCSVSSKGNGGVRSLEQEISDLMNLRERAVTVFPQQIAFNLFPAMGSFQKDESTEEENALAEELARLLEESAPLLSVTFVQVPLFYGHSYVLDLEMEKKLSPKEVRAHLVAQAKLSVIDNPHEDMYPMPIQAMGENEVQVGRIRTSPSRENGLLLWACGDNLRTTARNLVGIAEALLEQNLLRVPDSSE